MIDPAVFFAFAILKVAPTPNPSALSLRAVQTAGGAERRPWGRLALPGGAAGRVGCFGRWQKSVPQGGLGELGGPRGSATLYCMPPWARYAGWMNDEAGIAKYEEILRAAGFRITRQRQLILNILNDSAGHPDATEIFERANRIDRRISLATVYRTMKVLEESGTIQRHAFEGGPARFEQNDGEHHDHLIDLDTGEVIEFASERIEALQEEIAAKLGYRIEHHRLELYGRKVGKGG